VFSKELLGLLSQVVKSWEVIAVTVALIFYLNIVFYAAKSHNRRSAVKKVKKKPAKAAAPAAAPVEAESDSASTDDLILDEE
jgi:hypothetical protein